MLLAIDTETTGVDPVHDRIVEVAIVALDDDLRVLGEWSQRFNPGMPIPDAATAVHGIRDEDVAYAPPFAKLVGQAVEWAVTKEEADAAAATLSALWGDGTPCPVWLWDTANDAFSVQELGIAISCFEQCFIRGHETHPAYAADACIRMGIFMHGLWTETEDGRYRELCIDWWQHAAQIAASESQSIRVFALYLLHRVNSEAAEAIVTEVQEAIARLAEPHPLMPAFMERLGDPVPPHWR